MFDAVLLRHDCVHRNGADDEGRPREVFSKAFVRQTADSIRNWVVGIEHAVVLRRHAQH